MKKLEYLVLWDFDPSAIQLSPFYKQLLEWCDCVDAIRPTPPDTVVEYPIRVDEDSEDEVCGPSDYELPPHNPISFSEADADYVDTQPKKRGRGKPHKQAGECTKQSKKAKVTPESGQTKKGRGRPRKQPDQPRLEPQSKARAPALAGDVLVKC